MPFNPIDFRGVLLLNPPPYDSNNKKYRSDYYNGNRPPITGLTLLKSEDFSSGTLASKSSFIHLQSGNEDYTAIVNQDSTKGIRHNFANDIVGTDPISGKARSGLSTHTFLSNTFHTGTEEEGITFEMDFTLDHSNWKSTAETEYPLIAGKLFMSSAEPGVDSEAWYLGLTSGSTLTLVSGNNGTTGATWSHSTAGGWSSPEQNRPYAWKKSNGTFSNNIYMSTGGKRFFASDGVKRTFRFEIKYNPGGIGHHKARISIDGNVLFDSTGVNTDADGWFALPIEYKFKGPRWYVSGVDINNPDDTTNQPASYHGYAGGVLVSGYRLWKGVYGNYVPFNNEGYDVIFLHGQSNMRGNAEIRTGIDDDYSGLDHVFMYNDATGTVVPATNPLPHQDTFANAAGMWLQFVKRLPKNRKILLVPGARGATGFGIHWNKGNSVYNEFVERCNAAMASHASNTAKYFLSHLGETDANNENPNFLNDYKTMRTNMIADIAGLSESTPWVVGTLGVNGDAWRDTISAVNQQLAADIPAIVCVQLSDIPIYDSAHFTAAGLQTMGNRYYEILQGS